MQTKISFSQARLAIFFPFLTFASFIKTVFFLKLLTTVWLLGKLKENKILGLMLQWIQKMQLTHPKKSQ